MNNVINKIKLWLFPSIISILSTIIYLKVSEASRDIKSLVISSAETKIEIDNIKRRIDKLEGKVFSQVVTPVEDSSTLPYFFFLGLFKQEEQENLINNTKDKT